MLSPIPKCVVAYTCDNIVKLRLANAVYNILVIRESVRINFEHNVKMPKGPQGQKRPADAIGAAVMVAQIATGEIDDNMESGRVRLKINNFGSELELNKAVREYYDLFVDFCGKTGMEIAIHTKHRFLGLGG